MSFEIQLNRRACVRAAVCALFLFVFTGQMVWAVDVPTKHPVYGFLQRMEARGLLEKPLPQTFPYSRFDVKGLLEEVETHHEKLSGVEQKLLAEYESQFADENAFREQDGKAFRLDIYRNGHDLAELSGKDWAIYGNPVFEISQERHRFFADSTGEMTVWASGFDVRGSLKRFGFNLRATDAHVRGDARLADRTNFPYRYDVRPSGFDYDEADAAITYQAPHIDLLLGKTRNRWGAGTYDALILSDQPTSYTQARAKFTLGPLQLTALQAKLQQRPPVIVHADTTAQGVARLQYAEKFLAAHRLQWNAGRRLQIGVYEAVMYGERGFDFDYLNPMMFLRSAEHYADDRDNALMGFDFKWRPLTGIVAHGELLIDDVSTTKLGEGFYGNKLGYQGGAEWYDPAGWRNTRLLCEYTRIEPYVYSHKFAINSYQQYGSVLGASTGPNSDVLTANLAWNVTRALEVELWSQLRRHGANPTSGRNVGGDPRRPWGPGDATHVNFLDGDLETARTVGLQGRAEIYHDVYLGGSVSFTAYHMRHETGLTYSEDHTEGSVELRWNPW